MKAIRTYKTVLLVAVLLTVALTHVQAQNKDIDKAHELLKKALEQTDNFKKQDMINKAKEMFAKGGLKPQEVNNILGEAYLEKGDLVNAQNSFNTASKEDKKIGLKKVAEAYVDLAFSGDDEKNAPKHLRKAMDLFGKAGDSKEGARLIGDRYFEKGSEFYDKALEYYLIGEATVKVEQIANKLFEKGGDNEVKAAEAYLKLKNPYGYQKAGDIFFNRKEYQRAIDAYLAGNVVEGIKKYAAYLYAEDRDEEADNLFLKLAEIYAEKHNDDDLEKLAKEVQEKGSYELAAKIYDKAGNAALAEKSRAYDALINLKIETAKSLFNAINDAAMVKAITDNEKILNALSDVGEALDQLAKGAPFVSLLVDSITGKKIPSPSDQKMMEDYYKSVRDQIITNVNLVSINYGKLNSDALKKYVKIRFKRYGAVRNILDAETFAVKKQKQDVKVKDVIL